MERLLRGVAPYLYALMRIVVGLLFACHGAQKLFGVLGGFGGQSGMAVPLFSLMGLASFIEFVGGLLIAFGALTSYAAFIASGEMAVAYFMQHFPRGFWPIQNGGERAVLYCFVFLFIAAKGSGRWSLAQGDAASEPTPMQKAEQHTSTLSE
jgi:putative oxidoreductase